jgi:hypothetical protein
MSKHTPGPWAIYRDGLSVGKAKDHTGICEVWERSASDGFANAHLIAAAPELLEALEGLRDFCEQAGFPCDRANRVIAKAKGEAA